jgi:hypothetical protein
VGHGLTALLFRRRRKLDDNIRKDFKELGYEGLSFIDLAEDRDKGWALVNRVRKSQVAYNAGNCKYW